MMRTVIGALIFSLTFFVGVKVAWVAGVVTKFSMPAEIHIPDVNDRAERFARSPVGVRVSYIGLTGPTLRFLIHNGSTETLSCVGYSGMCASPELRINGEDAKAWVCMNGSSTYTIEPGETAELVVGPYDFARLPRKTETVAVGYEFKHPGGRSDHYFAEPVVLPAEFRDEIREHLTQRGE